MCAYVCLLVYVLLNEMREVGGEGGGSKPSLLSSLSLPLTLSFAFSVAFFFWIPLHCTACIIERKGSLDPFVPFPSSPLPLLAILSLSFLRFELTQNTPEK